jgi:hypothetical protein
MFLIFGVWPLPSLYWTGLMLLSFMIGLTQAYVRGLNISCGCFSISAEADKISLLTLLRDWSMVLLWAIAFFYYFKNRKRNTEGIVV